MTSQPTGCRETFDVQGYLDQQLTLPERIRFERHLKECPDCTRKVAHMEKLFLHLEQSCMPMAEDRVSPESLRQVMSRLGKTASAPAPEEHGTLFDLLNELRRLQKTLLAGFAVCAVLVLVIVGTQFRTTPGSIPQPEGTLTADRFACQLVSKGQVKRVGVSADLSDSLVSLESAVMYELGEKAQLQVTPESGQLLMFRAGARFSVTRVGVTLETGEVRCDLDRAPGYTVVSPHGTVVTVGTVFGVSVQPTGTQVTLERGEILVKTLKENLNVKAPSHVSLNTDGTIALISGGAKSEPPTAVQHQTGVSIPVQGVTSVPTSPAAVNQESPSVSPEASGVVAPMNDMSPASVADNINQAY